MTVRYGDRTFCASPACRNECGRQFTAADRAAAIRLAGGEDFACSWSSFCDSEGNLKQGSDAPDR